MFSLLPANSSRMGDVTFLDSYHRPVMAFALQGEFVGGTLFSPRLRLAWHACTLALALDIQPFHSADDGVEASFCSLAALLYYCFLDQHQSDRW